jgi:hypothetical protein
MGYDPERWRDLYVMLGGASAALAGLVFVGLSIHARAVAADPLHRMRGRNLTAGIIYITLVSALLLIPGQSTRALGAELIVGGCMIGGLFAQPLVQFRDLLGRDLAFRMLLAVTACALSVAAGASLIADGGGGLYLLVPATVLGVVLNVFGAWSLLLGLARVE